MNDVAAAADRIWQATQTGRPADPVRTLIAAGGIGAAHAVQEEVLRRRLATGSVIVGHNIGLTSAAVQVQLGVDQPDFGVLFDDMDVSEQPMVPYERLIDPKVEAEIAFVLGADLDGEDLAKEQVRAAVDYAVAALEIVDSRVRDWDITIVDSVADNACGAFFVLSADRVSLEAFTPRDTTMRMYADGVLVSEGHGSDCLGDPLNALTWLANTACSIGTPLRAGHVVLSGALGPMVPAPPGVRFRAEMSSLGEVAAQFAPMSTS